jgi:hypothetical protein
MIRALCLAAGLALAVTACAQGGPPRIRLEDRERQELLRGDPSKVIAAELAFARMAREQGTWTAFRGTSIDTAQWPTPALTRVQQDLAGRADPAQPIVWGPDLVWISCDGSFALSTGPATRPDGTRNRFATIWQRQRDGEYKWVLDQGFDLEAGYAAVEMIGARVAACPPGGLRPPRGEPEVQRTAAWGSGRSNDGSLEWDTRVAADCSRTLVVRAAQAEGLTEVFRRQAAPPAAPAGQSPPSCPA